MITFRKTLIALAAASTLFAAAPANAADPSNAELMRLIRQQSEQIKVLEKRLSDVETQKAAAPAAKEAEVGNAVNDAQQSQIDDLQAQVAQMSAGGGNSGSIDWSDGGPEFRSPDGFFTFHPRGRVLLDFSATNGSNYDARNIKGTEARDLRLGAEGDIGKMSYKLDVAFSEKPTSTTGNSSVKDAWIKYTTKALGMTEDYYLGNRLKDRSIEGSGTLSEQPFMERNAVASLGQGVNGYYGLGAFTKIYGSNWHLGMSVSGDDIDNAGAESDSIMYAIRGHWNPVKGSQGFVHLGGWYFYETLADDVASINNIPRIAQDFNDNLRVSASSIANPARDSAYGYEVGGVFRSLWAFGEYAKRTIGTDDYKAYNRKATSFEAGWLITGEKPGFSTRSGIWTDTHVLRPVNAGGIGGWEIATRFDRYDFRSAGTSGGLGRSTTVGVNWYLNDWSRLMLDWVKWNTDNFVGAFPGYDTGNSVGLRAQVLF